MNKKQFLENHENLRVRAELATDLGLTAKKGTDCGAVGKLFESYVKLNLGNTKGRNVSRATRVDTRKNGHSVEIKSNCGELISPTTDIRNSEYVFYGFDISLDNQDEWATRTYVLSGTIFYNMLDRLGLVREKTATDGGKRITIQSYKNSKKKYNAFQEALAKAPTLADYLKMVGR